MSQTQILNVFGLCGLRENTWHVTVPHSPTGVHARVYSHRRKRQIQSVLGVGGLSSDVGSSSSEPVSACLNSRIPWPSDLPTPASLPPPKITSTIARTITHSHGPIPENICITLLKFCAPSSIQCSTTPIIRPSRAKEQHVRRGQCRRARRCTFAPVLRYNKSAQWGDGGSGRKIFLLMLPVSGQIAVKPKRDSQL